jgi:hypothetical protein
MNELCRLICFGVVSTVLSGCAPNSNASAPAVPEQPGGTIPQSHSKRYSLAIVGYNYTDRYIDTFEVNGQGGGNLDISNDVSGGGSNVCCVSWLEGSKLPRKVTIKWVAGYCMQRRTNSAGETKDWREPLLKIADVDFSGPVPPNPKNFEVHFFPDGRIELALTESRSLPRLKLPSQPNGYVRPGVVVNDPPCAPGYDRLSAFRNPARVDVMRGHNP